MRVGRTSRARRRGAILAAASLLALLLLLPVASASAQDIATLNPGYPIVDGHTQVTEAWSIELDQPHNRTEQGSELVLFRPGFTIWISAWGNDNDDSINQRVSWIASETPRDAYDVLTGPRGPVYRHAFRRDEVKAEGVLQGYYGYTVAEGGHLQMAIFIDAEEDLPLAKSIIESVRYKAP
jgi:hypothetical protein